MSNPWRKRTKILKETPPLPQGLTGPGQPEWWCVVLPLHPIPQFTSSAWIQGSRWTREHRPWLMAFYPCCSVPESSNPSVTQIKVFAPWILPYKFRSKEFPFTCCYTGKLRFLLLSTLGGQGAEVRTQSITQHRASTQQRSHML